MEFFKYQGAGNDFIIVDLRKKQEVFSRKFIETLCDRRFGVGADGFMIFKGHQEVDFEIPVTFCFFDFFFSLIIHSFVSTIFFFLRTILEIKWKNPDSLRV